MLYSFFVLQINLVRLFILTQVCRRRQHYYNRIWPYPQINGIPVVLWKHQQNVILSIGSLLRKKKTQVQTRKGKMKKENVNHLYAVSVLYNPQLEPCAALRCKFSVAQLMAYSSHLMLLLSKAELHLWKGMDYGIFTHVAQTQRALKRTPGTAAAVKGLHPLFPLFHCDPHLRVWLPDYFLQISLICTYSNRVLQENVFRCNDEHLAINYTHLHILSR